MPPQISIVLPAHNEEELIDSTVSHLVEGMDRRGNNYEIIIVENGSTDRTRGIANALATTSSGINVISLPVGDYGAALAVGFRAAKGDVVVSFDVDYFDLGFLDAASALISNEGVDYVVASKRSPDSNDQRPPIRRLLTFGFTALLRLMVNLPVSDAHGIKAFRRATVAPFVEACQLKGSMFDVELICRAGRAGLIISEVPASVIELRPVRSPVGRRAVEGLVLMVRLRRLLQREEREAMTRDEAHFVPPRSTEARPS